MPRKTKTEQTNAVADNSMKRAAKSNAKKSVSKKSSAKLAYKGVDSVAKTRSESKQSSSSKKVLSGSLGAADAADILNSGTGQVIFSLQAGTPIFVKTADVCLATGKTNQWIGQLTSQGVLHKCKTNHGQLYSIFDTMRAYCTYLEERAKKDDEDICLLELRKKQAEVKLKESKATVAELEAVELQGKMHRSEDVQAMTADLLYYVRGSLLALAGRCATDCAASSDPAEIQKIIEREVFAILKDLSEYKYDHKRYEELVRERMKRNLDTAPIDDDSEE